MEMRYFWIVDQVRNKHARIVWHPGAENLGMSPSTISQNTINRYVLCIHINPTPNANSLELKHQVPCEGALILPAGLSSPASSPAWYLHALGSTMQGPYRPAHNPITYQSLLSNHKLVRT
jgi:hypothetical protein